MRERNRSAPSRIAAAFQTARSRGRATLVGYVMAGDPSLAATESLALACERGGADILEIGIPFSDPIADGPEIQAAGVRSLRAGTRPGDVLDLAARVRRTIDMPIVLMTYVNPVLAMGLETFASRAARAGVDGLIVPDLPFEESDDVRRALDAVEIDHIQMVAPSTPEDRAQAIGGASRGFLYVVARYGTTGTRGDLPEDLQELLKIFRKATALPIAVGFGVSTPDHVRALARMGADGIVVGSAIVRTIAADPRPEAVEAFVRTLTSALH